MMMILSLKIGIKCLSRQERCYDWNGQRIVYRNYKDKWFYRLDFYQYKWDIGSEILFKMMGVVFNKIKVYEKFIL
jgi:hypothetical protein